MHTSGRVLGGPGQQAERPQPDQEPVGLLRRAQAERGPQRLALWRRNRLQQRQVRQQQLVQPGEAELQLRLDARHHVEAQIRVARHGMVDQCRLADPGVAPHHQGAAQPVPHRLQHAIDRLGLAASIKQPDSMIHERGPY